MTKNFEEQFRTREFVETNFGVIETVDIKPQRPKTSMPVLFAPGWRETPELQKECLHEVHNSGRRVITFVHTKKLSIIKNQSDYPEVEIQKAKTILEILAFKGVKKVDVITHSEGALNVTIAAILNPEQFRNLVLIAPAGLSGANSITNIATGFTRHVIRGSLSSVIKHRLQINPHRKTINVLQNISLALKEAKAIAIFDLHPLLIELERKGVHIAVLVGEKDTVFPYEKVRKHLSKIAEPPNYGINIFATKPGGHELYSKPHEIMPQVEKLLKKLGK